jgi:hypothetical protein
VADPRRTPAAHPRGPGQGRHLREAAAANRARAADSQALLGRPFEHADTLKAALAHQQELDALMRAKATAKTTAQATPNRPRTPRRQPARAETLTRATRSGIVGP